VRILRLTLVNFRGVERCTVAFPTEGVTIVEGPNEVGKTSITEAIDLILSERDDSTKRAVRAVKPAGRDVGAEVEIELCSGPYRLVYRKRWHRQRMTELEILAPLHQQLSGREAHDRVRAILAETLDEQLWSALRLRQGAQLEQAALAGGSLGRALDLAAGGVVSDEREDELWPRILAERDLYWTPTGHERVDRVVAREQLVAAELRVSQLEEAIAALEEDATRVERLLGETAVLRARQEDQTVAERELAARFQAIERRRQEVEQLAGREQTAVARYERAAEVMRSRTELVDRADRATAEVSALSVRSGGAEPAMAAAQSQMDAAVEAVAAGRRAVRLAEAAHRVAVADETFRRQEIEFAQLSERLGRVEDAVRRRQEAEGVLGANQVDARTVKRIQGAHLDVARAEAAASAGASTIRAEAFADVGLRVAGAPVALGAGEVRSLEISSSIELEVPGVVRVVVSAGVEAQAAAERLSDARAALDEACRLAGVEDLAGAQVAAEARGAALRQLEEADRTIAQDLRDLTTEALRHKVAGLGLRIATYRQERCPEPPPAGEFGEAKRIAAERESELSSLREALARAEGDESAASEGLHQLRLDAAGTKAALDQARELEARERDALGRARQDAPDTQVAGALADASVESARIADELRVARAELEAQDPTSVEARLVTVREVLIRIAGELHDHQNLVRELRTRLAVKGEEGLAHQLDSARSELVRRRAHHDGLEARAAAVKLLHDVMAARRAEAHRQYVAPFRERIEGLGRIVFGPSLAVELDDDLRIARRTLQGDTLDFDDLSTGAQEQLGMISRLACATIVAADGGAPVIFDDALGWSDPGKLDGMGAVIRTAGQSCQIIVLTCTPGRYAGVGKATVVKLPA
jgi:hypothetical protein